MKDFTKNNKLVFWFPLIMLSINTLETFSDLGLFIYQAIVLRNTLQTKRIQIKQGSEIS